MNRLTDSKMVFVMRPTRLAELVTRFNTVSQARFYIEHQGADFSDYLREDEAYRRAFRATQAALAELGRVHPIDRKFLPNFVFAPEDTIVVLGQDGLVANTLKYLHGQPVLGVNPDPARWDGRLLPFQVRDLPKVMPEVLLRKRPVRSVTMAKAALNNGLNLYAVNDLFIGPKSHSSARYLLRSGKACEAQSSSGVIVSTGLGATGWLKSLLTGAETISQLAGGVLHRPAPALVAVTKPRGRTPVAPRARGAPDEFAWNANHLFYTVREPFPSQTTGTSLVFGRVTPETPLIVDSCMAENGVIFSDGIEKDFLEFNAGTRAVIGIAERKGVLVE